MLLTKLTGRLVEKVNPPAVLASPAAALRDPLILAFYRELLGDRHRDIFERMVMTMAREILGDRPLVYEEILRELIEVGGDLKPSELESFWRYHVTADTFEFQKRFADLRKPCSMKLERFVFHVGSRQLLESIKDLVPLSIRKGWQFDPAANKRTDDYHVCFADGTIDQLATYLAGHSMFDADIGDFIEDVEEENGQCFSKRFAVAVVEKKDTSYDGPHNIETLYCLFNEAFVETYETISPVSIVRVIKIPITILLDDQIESLKQEGRRLFSELRQGRSDLSRDGYAADSKLTDAMYIAQVHAELALKYALLEFAKSHPSPRS